MADVVVVPEAFFCPVEVAALVALVDVVFDAAFLPLAVAAEAAEVDVVPDRAGAPPENGISNQVSAPRRSVPVRLFLVSLLST